jgi:hypothetical protein
MTHAYINFNYGSFLRDEELKKDGSNFIEWYRRLRMLLVTNDKLYVIQKPLGVKPGFSASEEDDLDYRTRRDDSITVQCAMLFAMETELRERFDKTEAYQIVVELKALFAPQVRVMRYQYLDLFLSTKMEEHGDIKEHTATMYGYAQRLSDLDYKLPDDLAVDGVLRSLPPSYKSFIQVYHKQEEYLTFSEMLTVLISIVVKLNDEEVVDGEGIYDIHVIDVFPYKCSLQWLKYFDTGPVL